MNLLSDHQVLQPSLKLNRAHKQYSARLTRWLDRLGHFDVNVQYTAGKNIPLTDYLSRHPIAYGDVTETGRENNEHDEIDAEEEYGLGLFDFNRTDGSITQDIEQLIPTRKTDQSQSRAHTSEQNQNNHSIETNTPQIRLNSIQTSN